MFIKLAVNDINYVGNDSSVAVANNISLPLPVEPPIYYRLPSTSNPSIPPPSNSHDLNPFTCSSHVESPTSHHTLSSPSSLSCSSTGTLVSPCTFSLQDLKLLYPLGEGAHGSVYCARYRPTREKKALKVIPKEQNTERQIPFLLAEQNVMSLLHDNAWFVDLHASWGDSRNFYFAMQWHPTDLHKIIIREGKLEPCRARFYMTELIVALTFLHASGIVHRDVKPANILISRTGHVVLGDFGLAKDFQQVPSSEERVYQPYWPYLPTDEPSSGMPHRRPSELVFVEKKSCGTPVYMAPEIFAGEPYSFGVDFWAAAITLFIMLTGRAPWASEDPHAVAQKVLHHDLEIKEGLMEKEAEDSLRKMLVKLPSKRLRSGRAMESHPYFADTNWRLIAKRAVAIPDHWLPVEEPSFVGPDGVESMIAGHSYDDSGNKNPYPEFCWISEQIKKGIVDMEAVDVDAESLDHMCTTEVRIDVRKMRRHFFRRFITRFKNLARRVRRRTPPSHQDSFYSLPPTPMMSSYESSFCP